MPFVERTIEIQASPSTVWELMSTPEGLRAWWEPELEIELKVGGQYRFFVPEADVWISGYVLEMEPERRLVLSWFEEGTDWRFPIRLTFALEPIEGGTRVSHRYDGFAGIGKPTWDRTQRAYEVGVDHHQLLARLKEKAEGEHAA